MYEKREEALKNYRTAIDPKEDYGPDDRDAAFRAGWAARKQAEYDTAAGLRRDFRGRAYPEPTPVKLD